jgi:hypothetical protein
MYSLLLFFSPYHWALVFPQSHGGDVCLFVVYLFIAVFGYCWRALFAGNESKVEHGGNIANKKCQ